MLQSVKLNILIPLEYNKNEFDKSLEANRDISKSQAENCKAVGAYNCAEWFHYCFRNKPIENNFQMANSPLVTDENYQISRIELESVLRSFIGLHKNENAVYTIEKSGIDFTIGKIRILFTRSRIAFLHFELFAVNLTNSETRIFISSFGQITSNQPKMIYEKKVSKDTVDTVKVLFKDVVLNVIKLQSYLPISEYEKKITPYIQVCLIGTCDYEEKLLFFDSVQALSKRASSRCIEESHMYVGREEYISRFVGDRSVCIYGDTEMCGDDNLDFITDRGNGLMKTATENYTTVYAYLISLQLLVKKNDLKDLDIKYLVNAPLRVSDEDNIREFFEKCLWNAGWNLNDAVSSLKRSLQMQQDTDTAVEIERLGKQMEEHDRKLTVASDILKGIDQKVDSLVDFVRTDLKLYMDEEKAKLNHKWNSCDRETEVSGFTQAVSSHIDRKIIQSGDEIVSREREGLELLFGDKWKYLMPTSQTSLVSAGVLLKRCSDINTPDFDFSGICICATAALEAELKRVFFDGLLKYMVDRYGEPRGEVADKIYENWPDALLTVPKYQFMGGNCKVRKINHFTMGTLPFLFGESGNLSDSPKIREYQLLQSEQMKKRMSEYLSEIVENDYQNNPFEAFYIGIAAGSRITSQGGCFVWKCEKIRNDYRNKAAHVNVISEQEAACCYQSIIRKPDGYVYNAEITGVILELFSKVDGRKLDKVLCSNKNNTQKPASCPGQDGTPTGCRVGRKRRKKNFWMNTVK